MLHANTVTNERLEYRWVVDERAITRLMCRHCADGCAGHASMGSSARIPLSLGTA